MSNPIFIVFACDDWKATDSIHLIEPVVLSLEMLQFIVKAKDTGVLFSSSVQAFTVAKHLVIDETHAAEGLGDKHFLLRCWVDAVFNCLASFGSFTHGTHLILVLISETIVPYFAFFATVLGRTSAFISALKNRVFPLDSNKKEERVSPSPL